MKLKGNSMSKRLVSIVIPVYNSEQTIGDVCARMSQVFASLAYSYEVVMVDDGSADHSWNVLQKLSKENKAYKAIRLMRNFGEHHAVMAGLNHARGDYTVIMDDDGQNPPEEVPLLLREIEEGHDVVYTYYAEKKHHPFRNLGSKFNDIVATYLLKKPKNLYLSSFKIMNKLLREQVVKYTGPYPYIDGLVLRSTRNIGKVLVNHESRHVGKSNYTFMKLVALWLNMFTNFSILPLRLTSLLGFGFSVIGFIMGIIFAVEKIIHPDISVGYASIVVLVVGFAGIQLLIIGMMGEYIGRLFLTNNQTPQFIVRESKGL